ncbi:MAG: chromate transporter [Clostridia bacterium]|nr:chromate transporter [Clostridia bacterium]
MSSATTLLLLCLNFMKAGLFAVGGGLATLPFITDISTRHPDWFTHQDIADMVAISESTPGPLGINMSTYIGYKMFGVGGAVLTTLSLVLPSFVIILVLAKLWKRYKDNERVQKVFGGLRPAAIGLIFAAGFSVFLIALFPGWSGTILHDAGALFQHFNWRLGLLFSAFFAAMQTPKIRDLHPILFIVAAAALGIVFKL